MLWTSSNIVLCCYIHQVIACTLYAKKVNAYQKYVSLSTEIPVLPMSLWKKTKLSPYVQVLESNYPVWVVTFWVCEVNS